MILYAMRLDYSDGAFEIADVLADTLEDALTAARYYTDAQRVSCVGMRDTRPADCLAFRGLR